jgi:hypothetical protein
LDQAEVVEVPTGALAVAGPGVELDGLGEEP